MKDLELATKNDPEDSIIKEEMGRVVEEIKRLRRRTVTVGFSINHSQQHQEKALLVLQKIRRRRRSAKVL